MKERISWVLRRVEREEAGPTRGNVVTLFDGDVREELENVDGLEDVQSLPDRVHSDVLERRVVQVYEHLARDAVLDQVGRVLGVSEVGEEGIDSSFIERGQVVLRQEVEVVVLVVSLHRPLGVDLADESVVSKRSS